MAPEPPRDRIRSPVQAAADLAAWSAGHPGRAAALALVVVLLAGAGLPGLDRTPDPAQAVPRGDGTAEATDAVTTHFKSTVLQKATVQFPVNPDACRADSARNLPQRHGPGGEPGPEVDCGNVTDEVYLRALEEFFRFLRDQHPVTGDEGGVVTYMMAPSTFHKLANWTVAGGHDDAPPGAFQLPPPSDRARWRTVEEVTHDSFTDAMAPTLNRDRTAASAVLVVEPQDPRSPTAIGEDVLEARDAYLEWALEHGNYTVFTGSNPPLVGADPPAEGARTSTVLEDGLAEAVPASLAAAALLLLAVTRRPRATAAGLAVVAGTATAAVGAAGWARVGVSPYLLAVLPVAAGLGLAAALQLLGPRDADEPWRAAGEAAAPSLLVGGAAVAAAGLVWAASPAPLVAGAGIPLAAAALAAPPLALLLVPALAGAPPTPRTAGRRGGLPGPAGLPPGRRARRVVLAAGAVALLLAPGLLAATTAPPEPAVRNLPEDDPLRREHERSMDLFFGPQGDQDRYRSHIVVVRGDVLDPGTHRYLDALLEALEEEAAGSPALDASTSRHLPFLVRKWQEVGDGTESVARSRLQAQLPGEAAGSSYPDSREGIRADLDAIFDSPMATFGSLLVDHPRDRITVVPVMARTGTLADLRASQAALDDALARAEGDRPDDVAVGVAGPGTTTLKLHQEQTPWLAGAGLVALAAAGATGAWLRGRRAGLQALQVPAAAALAGLAAAGWAGAPVRPAFVAPLAAAAASAGWPPTRDRPRRAALAGLGLAATAAPFALVPYRELAQASLVVVAVGLAAGLAVAALQARGTASQG